MKLYNQNDDIIKVPRFKEEAGFYTTKQRSKAMAKIKGKNTKAEIILRRALWAKGIRYCIHVQNIPGKPDVVIEKYKLAIFVDGSFWHGYNWIQKKQKIKSNVKFWVPKIERNMQRDQVNKALIEDLGYTVMRFWDHDIKKNLDKCLNQICLYIETARDFPIPIKY